MFTYSIKLDKNKDVRNWRDWCNHISYWFDWTKNINPEYFDIVQKLKNCTLEESYNIMDEFIDSLYNDRKKEIDLTIEYANLYFQKWFQKACECMEKITWKPLYRNDFTIYLTSFPRCPYNFEEWYLLIPFFWDGYASDRTVSFSVHDEVCVLVVKNLVDRHVVVCDFRFLERILVLLLLLWILCRSRECHRCKEQCRNDEWFFHTKTPFFAQFICNYWMSASIIAFIVCFRFSAWSHTLLKELSNTSSVTSCPFTAGRQCMNIVPAFPVAAMRPSFTWYGESKRVRSSLSDSSPIETHTSV